MNPLEPLEFAAVAGTGRKIDGHDVWRAPCTTRTGDSVIYVKALDLRRLLIELFCAQIGRAMNLPVPQPFLVHAGAHSLAPNVPAHPSLFFGAKDERHPSLAAWSRDKDQIVALLRKWRHKECAATFDSLICNEDRTEKNYLFGAADNAIWLIDHEDALRGTFNHDDVTKNEIVSLLLSGLVEIEQQALLRDTTRFAVQVTEVDITRCEADPALAYLEAEAARHATALVSFLTKRRSSLPTILQQQIKPRQGGLPFYDASSSAFQRDRSPI